MACKYPERVVYWFCCVVLCVEFRSHIGPILLRRGTFQICKYTCCFLWFSKSSDTSVQRFDKSLEEFYALCDQLELCLVRNIIIQLMLKLNDRHSLAFLFFIISILY